MRAQPHETTALRFADLSVGRRFGPQSVVVDTATVRDYVAATGDDDPLYTDAAHARGLGFDGPIVPPGLVGVLARRAYLDGHHMLPGGVMAGQDIELHGTATVGSALELVAEVEVVDRSHPRRRVVLRSEVHVDGRLLGLVRIDARWPADEEAPA